MNLDVKNLPTIALQLLKRVKRFVPLLFILATLFLYGYLVLYINELTQVEADELAVLEELQSTSRPEIDQAAVDKIRQLQDQNVQVETLFEEARENPFSE